MFNTITFYQHKIPGLKFNFIFVLICFNFHAHELTNSSCYALDIASNTLFYFIGLELLPNSDFQINGANDFTKSGIAINAQSVNRVYNFSNTFSNFQGDITFHYEDTELNSIDENNLVLQLEDATNIWNAYASTVNPKNNTVSYTFVPPISFLSVTASDGTSLGTNEFDQTLVQIFPNPAVDWVKINTDLKLETRLFDTTGKQMLKT